MLSDDDAVFWMLSTLILIARGRIWTTQFGYKGNIDPESYRPPAHNVPVLAPRVGKTINFLRTKGYVAHPRVYPRCMELTPEGRRRLHQFLIASGGRPVPASVIFPRGV